MGLDAAGLSSWRRPADPTSIGPQETANEDPRLEAGEAPNLFIFTRGRGRALFADSAVDLHEGMSVFVGPYVKHVITNPYDEPLEEILVLFGDNIDFARGVSYLDFSESLYRFYGDYTFDAATPAPSRPQDSSP